MFGIRNLNKSCSGYERLRVNRKIFGWWIDVLRMWCFWVVFKLWVWVFCVFDLL